MKEEGRLDNIFFPISKAVILIPLIVLITAVILKFTGGSNLSYKTVAITPTVVPPPATITPPKPNVNLTGPYVCEKKDASSSALIYIKNKSVFAQMANGGISQNALLKGDCLYAWKGTAGQKTCGMTNYIKIYETLASLGMVNLDTVLNATVSQSGDASRSALLRGAVDSCRRQSVDDSVFTYPGSVRFKEVKIDSDLQKLLQ